MRRQELIALLGGSLALWAWITPALTQTMPIIGFLNNGSPEPFTRQLEAFHQGLSAAGYNKDRNVAIEYRWAEGRYDRLQALAAELIGLNAKIIVATGGATTEQAARAQSATIPIVVVTGSDPDQVGAGANPRLGRRNVTGVSVHHAELAAKRLDVLRELVPRPAKLAYLLNPNQALAEIETRTVEAAARETGVNLLIPQSQHAERACAGDRRSRPRRSRFTSRQCRYVLHEQPRPDRRARGEARAARRLSLARICRGRRPDELWPQAFRGLS
jgi:putative ABC transport system substrate-binding protein